MTRFFALALALLLPTVSQAELITNGTFDAGLTGWTTFVTPNGVVQFPGVTSFDTNGDGVANPAASFNAGQVSFSQIPAGGGISQFVMVPELELYQFSADVAASTPGIAAVAGQFSILVDGLVLSTVDLGTITPTSPGRHHFESLVTLGPGMHEVRVQAVRPFLATPDLTQYADNVSLTVVPEPSSLLLLAVGALGWAGVRLVRRNTSSASRTP